MTSFAFILGCVPLALAQGAGGISRQVMGTVVIAGMSAATGIAIFLIPVCFYVIGRLSGAKHKPKQEPGQEPPLDRVIVEPAMAPAAARGAH
jgi:HAE1 family hydrophobic/amphiphilic exporter-1